MNRTNTILRTEIWDIILDEIEIIFFVRNKNSALKFVIVRTISLIVLQPRATLLRRLPWAIICWPFRPFLFISTIKVKMSTWCYNICSSYYLDRLFHHTQHHPVEHFIGQKASHKQDEFCTTPGGIPCFW